MRGTGFYIFPFSAVVSRLKYLDQLWSKIRLRIYTQANYPLASPQTSCGVCFCSSRIHFSPRSVGRNECVTNKNKPHRTSAGRLIIRLTDNPSRRITPFTSINSAIKSNKSCVPRINLNTNETKQEDTEQTRSKRPVY